MNRTLLCEEIERLRSLLTIDRINGAASGGAWTVKVRSARDLTLYGEGLGNDLNEAEYAAMIDLGKKLRFAPELLERKP